MRSGLHPPMADAIVEEFGGHNAELLFTGKPHTRSSSVPEGTWVYPGSFVDDQREQGVSDQANTLLLCAFSGGSDETRTRDLRRDRASFHPMNKRSALKPQRFQSEMRPVKPLLSP